MEREPARVGGAWVFRGSRVPVAALFENLGDGASLAEFVEWFPGVTAEQARGALRHVLRLVLLLVAFVAAGAPASAQAPVEFAADCGPPAPPPCVQIDGPGPCGQQLRDGEIVYVLDGRPITPEDSLRGLRPEDIRAINVVAADALSEPERRRARAEAAHAVVYLCTHGAREPAPNPIRNDR